jgi:hypothetical protein
MLRKIKLYGKLAKFIGHRVLEADVATAAEAVRFLLANWPELEAHMSDQHYRVSIGTYDIDLEELHHPAGAAPISFVPVVAGAGAVGRIILGLLLVAVAIIVPGGNIWTYQHVINRTTWRQSYSWRHRSTADSYAKGCSRRPTNKTIHANRTHSAASRTPAAKVCRCPLSTAKRSSAA